MIISKNLRSHQLLPPSWRELRLTAFKGLQHDEEDLRPDYISSF